MIKASHPPRKILYKEEQTIMDTELFALAVRAASELPAVKGIGTLSEYRLHSALKYYVQPDPDMHEIRRGGFVCDAEYGDAVFEIQTKAFERLRRKLDKLLASGTVTVVYPIIKEKLIITTAPHTGESAKRKSPRKGSLYDVFPELYKIRSYLSVPGFHLRLLSVGVTELRISGSPQNKKSRRRRPKEYRKAEIIPSQLFDDITLTCPDDYRIFLPKELPELFFSRDLARTAGISMQLAGIVLLILYDLKIIERLGRCKEGYLYTQKSRETDQNIKNHT